MPPHPAILSIREVFRRASLKTEDGAEIPGLLESISGLDTTKEIGENSPVTLDNVVEANNIAVAVRGYYASHDLQTKYRVDLITKMYHTAVENTYYNATFFRKLESSIASTSNEGHIPNGDLVRNIASVQTTANSAQTAADRAQITADNAQTAHQNSHRRYTENFSPLKKVIMGSGFDLANAVRPEHVNENSLNEPTTAPAQVGSTPLNFNSQIATYSDEDILKMIVFYNNQFGITGSDVLSERINKFRSFLSDCGGM